MISKHITKSIGLIVILLTLAFSSNAQIKADWQRDLDSLAVWLPQKHYNMFLYHDRDFFNKGIAQLKQDAEKCSNTEMTLKLQQFLVMFGDSHTNVNFRDAMSPNRIYPIGLACYDNDYYIIGTIKKYQSLLGVKLKAINGYSMKRIESRFSTLVVADSRSSILNAVPNLMSFAQIHEFFKLASGDSIMITYEKNGVESRKLIKAGPINPKQTISLRPNTLPMHIQNADKLFTETYMPDSKIYYIQYNKCWNRELEEKQGNKARAAKLPYFKDFTERIFKTLAEKDVKKLVFDLRYNGGGNSRPFTEFVKKMAQELKNHKDIKCYAVIGRRTFSSGILNSLDLKNYLNATYVGEVTSGCANHLGEIRSFVLPTSKVGVIYSTKYFKQADIKDGPLKPDVVKETSYTDFMRGTDPVLEWIKQQ